MTDVRPARVAPAGAAEEWIDARVHRPLAALLIDPLASTSISPDQVTVAACAVGLLSAAALWLGVTRPVWRLASAALLFGAVVLDCVDGQLARARGTSSRTGDMFDGLADLVVSASILTAVTYTLAVYMGAAVWPLGLVAGVSYGLQCLLFDFAKRTYLGAAAIRPLPTRGDLEQIQAAARQARTIGCRREAFLLSFYRRYFESHRSITSRFPAFSTAVLDSSRIRVWTWLGLGTHLAVLYFAIALSAVWLPALLLALLTFATVHNGLLVSLIGARSR